MCVQTQNPFRQPKEMDGVQKALAGLPGAVFYGAALLLVTAAGACGFVAGSRAPGASFEHLLPNIACMQSCYMVHACRQVHVGKCRMTKLLLTHSVLHIWKTQMHAELSLHKASTLSVSNSM